jgi:hypothetical protein
MQLYVELPAAQPTGENDDRAPGGGALSAVHLLRAGGELEQDPAARRWAGNLLELTPSLVERFGGGRLLVNSGSLADELGELDPRNWMAGGMTALAEHLQSLQSALEMTSTTLFLEPHSRHILHDAQCTAMYLRQHAINSVKLALNPPALFEPSMLVYREDHLQRILESLGPLAGMLVLSDAIVDQAGERLAPCPPGDGVFNSPDTIDAAADFLNPDTPIVLRQVGSETLPPALIDAIRGRMSTRAAD